jgi:hypothetical protein
MKKSEQRENDVILQQISSGWVGTKVFDIFFFAKVFAKFNFRFREKILAKVLNFRENFRGNLIFAVLEPLRFGSNQTRLSAAPALLKWPYKSCNHRYRP